MRKVTKPKQAVVFGSDFIATNWAKENDVPRENVVLATHPDIVGAMRGPIVVVRVPEELWKPTTFPDEKRAKETEEVLKVLKYNGQEVQEVKIDDAHEIISEEP